MIDFLKRTEDTPRDELKTIFERARSTVELLISDMIVPPGFCTKSWFPLLYKTKAKDNTIVVLTRLKQLYMARFHVSHLFRRLHQTHLYSDDRMIEAILAESESKPKYVEPLQQVLKAIEKASHLAKMFTLKSDVYPGKISFK